MEFPRRPIESLVSLCIDFVIKNLHKYMNDTTSLKLLPAHIKNRMLRKFTSSAYFWARLNFKKALELLIHSKTKRIDLSLANIEDEILEILSRSCNFQYLYLTRYENNCLTSKGVTEFISTLKNIRVLQISYCDAVNDDVLISVSNNCLLLTTLDVCGCSNVRDAGLIALSCMKNLIWLTFSSTQITNKGVEELIKGPSRLNIKELRLANCKYITGDILEAITWYCPNIEILVFYNLQPSESDDNAYRTFLPFDSGDYKNLKNLRQLTWTVQW